MTYLFTFVCNLNEDDGAGFVWLYSSGPQKCSACIKEEIFEESTSILKQGCVSSLTLLKSVNLPYLMHILACILNQ